MMPMISDKKQDTYQILTKQIAGAKGMHDCQG